MFYYLVVAIFSASLYLQVTKGLPNDSVSKLFPGFRELQIRVYQADSRIRQLQKDVRQLKAALIGCKTTSLGWEYRGHLSFTSSGRECQRWDSQYPHKQSYGRTLPGGAKAHANYCRTTKHSTGPWCYTTDKAKIWEYCSVPKC